MSDEIDKMLEQAFEFADNENFHDALKLYDVALKKEPDNISALVDIEEEISKFENVCGVYDITGSTDTIIIAKFKERNELSKFVKGLAVISNVENTITHVVLNTAKEDFRLS